MSNVTAQFIALLDQKAQSINAEAIKEARIALVDCLICAAYGAKSNGWLMHLFPMNDVAACSIIGISDIYTQAEQAAYINAFDAHSTELDDGYKAGMTHIGAVVVPAIIALSEERHIGLDLVLKGIVMGYEATARLARSINPQHKERGFHTTGTCGLIGATIGAAYMLGASNNGMNTAISCAATSAAGLLEIQEDASTIKAVNAAHAASAAVTAARMSLSSMTGPNDILCGSRGFATLLSDGLNVETLLSDTVRFEISNRYMKLYPACRHCHPAIEAALSASQGINPSEIAEIKITTYALAIKGHDYKEIKGPESAKLSIPYCVAAAITDMTFGQEQISSYSVDIEPIRALIDKVVIYESEQYTANQIEQRCARVEIVTINGTKRSAEIKYAKGDPENPLTHSDLIAKINKLTHGTTLKLEVLEKILGTTI